MLNLCQYLIFIILLLALRANRLKLSALFHISPFDLFKKMRLNLLIANGAFHTLIKTPIFLRLLLLQKQMELIGGQAVVEGVMMISPSKVAIAVRKPNGGIKTKAEKRLSIFQSVKKVYFLRGIFALIEMLHLGTKALIWSSNESMEKEEQISSTGMALTMVISFIIGIGLFVALPLWVTGFFTRQQFLFNLIEGIFRVLIFLAYLLLISQMKDVKRLFEYHGAEHMAVHCHEAKKKLEINNVRRFSTLHPRCGTAFIFLVLIVSILVFSFIWSERWITRFSLRLLLIPVVAGISYELLRLSAKHQDNIFFRSLIKPGLWFQMITTKEPDRKQIEVAIAALQKAI